MDARTEQLIEKSQRQFRAKAIFVLIALLIVASGIFMKVTNPTRRTLIDHATLVTDWRHSKKSSGALPEFLSDQNGYVFDHHWLPDGALLRVPFAVRERGTRFSTVATHLEKIDPGTGAVLSTKQIDLTTAQRSTLYEPLLSSDGKRLFLEESGDVALINTEIGSVDVLNRGWYGNASLLIIASTSDGRESWMETGKPGVQGGTKARRYASLADHFAWARDSQSFFETTLNAANTPCLQQRSLDDKLIANLPLAAWKGATLPQVLGQTSTGEILLVDRSGFYAENLYFVDLKSKAIRKAPIKEIQRGMLLKQIELSPDGTRLLWKTVNVNPSLMEYFQALAESIQHRENRCKVSIVVSELDGSKAKEIASEKLTAPEEDDFRTVHWLPDSKRVSFWYKGSIYAIPTK